MPQTHEITGHDDTWEYATTTVIGVTPPHIILHPPGEGWVPNALGHSSDGTRYGWKRALAYANREAVITAADPTTAQLEARNDELDRLRAEVHAWRDSHLTLELKLASAKRALDHMTKCNSDRIAELEQIRVLVGGPRLAYVVDGASALKLVRELMVAQRIAQEMNTDLNNFAAGDQQRAVRDASKIKRYEDALSEVRRGFYSTKTTLVYEDRTVFDRVYAMVDELIPDAMERADKLREAAGQERGIGVKRVMHLRRVPNQQGLDECVVCKMPGSDLGNRNLYTYEYEKYKADARRCERAVVRERMHELTSKDLATRYREENSELVTMAAEISRLFGVIRKYEDAAEKPAPIPMFLTCPMCNTRHVDVGEFATKPHHTHACQCCGLPWRPAIGPTVGVQYLPGFKNDVMPLTHTPRIMKDQFGNAFLKSCSCGAVFAGANPDDEYAAHIAVVCAQKEK